MPATRATMCAALCLTTLACGRPGGDAGGRETAAAGAPALPASACSLGRAPAGTRVLVFSRTTGYRHESIPAAVTAVRALGARHGFEVVATEDAGTFSDRGLRAYNVILFLNTTGDVLDAAQQAALERWVRAGGGFAGVHAASDTEYDWPWYGRLVGAWFKSHPSIARASIDVLEPRDLSTRCLPARWTRTDEWYDFRERPGPGVTVLATLDETTYQGATMGAPHPIAWRHEVDGGRAWYTALGHTTESWAEREFLDHLAGGILWAAGTPP